ncbi:MAG TPA: methylenetetrahydrofolate--tRNA-(uracil(54)-C(5))-methyltransferase (FADH(2)-oxidizing) TrmFO [Vicinamibacterales bacterium]|nr:methylenetetrahydrofolate--tRNA-(uracil(54)-C(5))-methyltransferase (FADH(2)-oxidizing) TrmFO [Vicinamibacterales bacterium]
MIRIVGGGLAGAEAAWQAASRGVPVTLHEMRPVRSTPVHKTDRLAELVCSNSFRGDKLDNAVGLLKEEMRRLHSLVMRAAEASRVPAGAALAVDRERFADEVTRSLARHPLVSIVREEVAQIPDATERDPVIIATGPLTSEALSADIARLVGEQHLYFYDAISPIVLAESVDRSQVFRASRWNRSSPSVRLKPDTTDDEGSVRLQPDRVCGVDDGEGDYLNCPLTKDQYERFHDALVHAESATLHDFDKEKFFEGCLPIEVMAHRGIDTLRFGPMKPVGLVDPRTGRPPYAAVQLRQDNLAGDHYSLVGFQTQLKWSEQARVLRLIPGLEAAEFVRFGLVHRNTYVNGPLVLDETWQVRRRPALFFAGQMSGVEGYVESAASGLMAGLNAARLAQKEKPSSPPRTTAMGALAYYVSHADPAYYDPSNITFGIMPPLPDEQERGRRGRLARKLALAERALADLERWRVGLSATRSGEANDSLPRPSTADSQEDGHRAVAVGDLAVEHGIEGGR